MNRDFKGEKPTPKKPPTPINPTENSLRKQFAQALSACLLFNVKERGRTVCTNSPENCLRKLFLLGWVFYGVGFPPLVLVFPRFPRDYKALANGDFSAIKKDKTDSHCDFFCDARVCSEKSLANGNVRFWCTQIGTDVGRFLVGRAQMEPGVFSCKFP